MPDPPTTAPTCAPSSTQLIRSAPLVWFWLMPSSTANSTTPTSATASKRAALFPPNVARKLGASAANLSSETAARMVERLGYCIPHYVQVYFDNVYRICRLNGISDVTPALTDQVYESQMLCMQGHAELSHL